MDTMAKSKTILHDLMVGAECKKHIKILIRIKQTDRNAEYKSLENHLYHWFYDILRSDTPEVTKLPALQSYKAKIVRLRAKYRVIHKSLRDFRTRLRYNQDRHGRNEHINR